jgi:hypothetical protein
LSSLKFDAEGVLFRDNVELHPARANKAWFYILAYAPKFRSGRVIVFRLVQFVHSGGWK